MPIANDLKFAARGLARTPGFAVTCILVLSAGIAISTAAFTVVQTVVKRPLPFPNPERLALIRERDPSKDLVSRASYPAFAGWRDAGRSFQEIGAVEPRAFNLGGGPEPESVAGATATAGFFKALGWKTVLGRSFSREEEQPGGPRVVLIGQRCWERRFGSDPNVVGRDLLVDGERATVVGVLARIIGRSYYASYEVWAPLVGTPDRAGRDARTLEVVALLKPGVGFAQAGAELDTVSRAAPARDPAAAGWGAYVTPMSKMMAHTVPMFVLLLGVAVLLLAVVCANVAALQLARAAGRRQEIALRVALGATRGRIIAHLLGEAFLVAGAGGALGFLFTAAVRQALVASVPELAELRLDAAVLAFTALVSIAAGLLFGLAPAVGASNPDLNAVLKSGGRTAQGNAGRRGRSALVVGEMAVAVTLLTGLGLLVNTFIALHHADAGFRTDNLVAVNVSLPAKYATPQQRAAFFRLAGERIRGLAGVESAAAVSAMPLAGGGSALKLETEGRAGSERMQGQYTVATPEYFRAMGIAVIKGRPFDWADAATTQLVAIVNECAAQTLWPGEDPLKRRVRLNGGEWRSVVAVVADVRQNLLQQAWPEFYVPHAQESASTMWMVARTRTGATQLTPTLRSELRALEPGLRISAATTIDDLVSGYFPGSVVAGMAAVCAVALFFATLGLYGVVSFLVAQRTYEFGVRIALGATPADVRRLVLGQGLKLAGIGAAIGLAAGFGLSRLLANAIAGIQVASPLVFAAVAALLAAAEMAACYFPARRAVRISPLEALRSQ